MSNFLDEEIKKDLDLVKRHIENVEKELMECTCSEQFVHLYETYERLLMVCNNDKNLKGYTFYAKRRDALQNVRKKMRIELDSLLDIDKKTYKKLIYTYDNIIRKYKELYHRIRNIQVIMLKNIKIHEIKYIEVKNDETVIEIVNYYNNLFSKTLDRKFVDFTDLKVVLDNSIDSGFKLGFKLQDKFIPIKLNEEKEFDIVLK